MLRFACVPSSALSAIVAEGLPPESLLFDQLNEAEEVGQGRYGDDARVLVIDAPQPESLAVLNVDPYLPPREVVAAGGLVVRAQGERVEVLLIHRRGAWDLPKGKQDLGETVAETAVREVQEEVGIETLHLRGEAGTTVHGYAEKKRYSVKTTTWFWMQTPQTTFVPEAKEGIEAVEYVPWEDAKQRLGYATLRDLLNRLDPQRPLADS
ncbi:MAG: NUDIX hydrolase [Bacteroidota bacterium]